jgi:hypothetical protein
MEYHVAQLEFVETDERVQEQLKGFLNDRAKEGWELVTVTVRSFTGDGTVFQYTLFFKKSD